MLGYEAAQRVSQEDSSPESACRGEARKALVYGLVAFLFGTAGLIAAVAYFQPNAASLTLRNTDEEPALFEVRITGGVVFCGSMILLCFVEAFRWFARARHLGDRSIRLQIIGPIVGGLSPKEILLLVEHGAQGDRSGDRRRQVRWWQPQLPLWPSRTAKGASEEGTAN